jgi:hypothetical protein
VPPAAETHLDIPPLALAIPCAPRADGQ